MLKELLFPILFFVASFALFAAKISIEKMRSLPLHQELKRHPWYYSILIFIEKAFIKDSETFLLDLIHRTMFITITGYTVSATVYIPSHQSLISIFLLAIPALSYFVIHAMGSRLEYATLKIFSPFVSLFLVIFMPITWPILWLERRLDATEPAENDEDARAVKIKHRLLEILQESDIKDLIDPQDKRLIKSIANFQDRVAREIMVPKVNIVAFSEDMSIAEAAPEFIREGFSRIPIYSESIDLITGVLLYKDVLAFLLEHMNKDPEIIKTTTLKTLAKPIVYAPEGKKISDLLQEMKQLQIHIIVIVNEYGCTEGIVTIEDILEEIVGNISDEHDIGEESLYAPTNDNAWIVDARMNIIDLETETGIAIPPDPEYETVGGFILHQINSFPTVGAVIHTDDFDIKVLSTGKRQIYKVKIIPTPHGSQDT